MLSFNRIFSVFLVLLAVAGCNRGREAEPILIGHIAPFAGPDKAIGDHAQQAISLAVAEVNKDENKITGRGVRVHHVDPQGNLDTLQSETVRLITVTKVVALLGGTDIVETERLGRAAQTYEVPVITSAELPPQLLGDNVFSVNVGQQFKGQVLARFAAEKLSAARMAVLVDSRHTAGAGMLAALGKEFSKVAGRQIYEWAYKSDAEFPELIQRAQKHQVQAIVYSGRVADLAALRSKLQAAKLTLPLLFAGGDEYLSALLADRKVSDGIYLATAYVAENKTEQNVAFVKEYQEQFHEPPDLHAALAYDGIRILFEALRRAKSVQPSKVRAELANSASKFDCLTGSLAFDKDHAASRTLFVVHVEDGRLKEAVPYQPEPR